MSAGNDTYTIPGAIINENPLEGFDTVVSTIDFNLPQNVEQLILDGSAQQGYGNGDANILVGNAATNLLNGQAGADTMIGGLGDDAYFVDDANDQIVENPNEGVENVYSTVNYVLPANVENLIFQGIFGRLGT